jgi:hypothetical protein
MYVPDVVYVVPFKGQVYVSHAVSVTDAGVELLMVKFKITIESQPAELTKLCEYAPELV